MNQKKKIFPTNTILRKMKKREAFMKFQKIS